MCFLVGGQYERLVDYVKKSLWNIKVNYIELQTVTLEIETILNNRPLYYVDENNNTLTPNHLLFGRTLNLDNINNHNSFDNDTNIEKLSKSIKGKIDHFWNLWKKDYLLSLREFHKISKPYGKDNIKVDDIVIIHNQFNPRQLWKIGKVIEIMPSRDNKIRWVKLNSNGHTITRPVNKLYPLEISDMFDVLEEKTKRPRREAAVIADLKRTTQNQL